MRHSWHDQPVELPLASAPVGEAEIGHRARGQTVDWLLFSAGVHVLHDEHTSTVVPAHTLAAEALTLERTLSDLVNQAYALTPAELALVWQTAPPRIPVPPPRFPGRESHGRPTGKLLRGFAV